MSQASMIEIIMIFVLFSQHKQMIVFKLFLKQCVYIVSYKENIFCIESLTFYKLEMVEGVTFVIKKPGYWGWCQ